MQESPLGGLPRESAALLVIDPQNAFVHPEGTLGLSGVNIAPAQHAMKSIRRLAEQFKAAGLPVIWTQQIHLEKDVSRDAKVLASHTQKRARVSALSGTWDADFVDEVADLVDDPTYVVTKHRFGAFYETRLDSLLRMLGVRTLFVTGVTANACVETTLREAYLRDYDVVAVKDGIAAVRPEWIDTAEAVWRQYLGVVANEEEVLGWLARGSRPQALGLHHLLLETKDLEAAESFYFEVLGFNERKREDFRDGRKFVATHQGLALVERASEATGTGGTLEHLCFRARGIDAIANRAMAAGHRIVRGPGPGPYGHTVYIEDPDGNEIELFDIPTTTSGSGS
ncbi:isochorismatase family protein [Arthrobacter sp. AK01]|uniref:isochorismatase family protein n=1 Tax=Micrococcaceae TaxID=1268 RepID=UPI001E5A376A|nr:MULTISPECIES: isochorismatase family protein [Micrococcaceae]MCD4852024.1 isochorismatase family protein [Arthrobacter sp. AK01]MCP1413757.1 nicotinamidase-related amidase/catechol 2,3-dioxygenase-like lactoylglutathione lyase family enzyme [Paenarthrobacter sp. A20]